MYFSLILYLFALIVSDITTPKLPRRIMLIFKLRKWPNERRMSYVYG